MTQREFAKLLNISQAAVSMALNDSPEISLERRRHIQELAEKLGYRPNLAGQLLRRGRSNLSRETASAPSIPAKGRRPISSPRKFPK